MSRIPFDPAETENAEEIPGFLGMMAKRFKTPITPKENYRMVYERKVPLWLPIQGDSLMLTPRVDPDNVARCFCFEANPLKPEEMIGGPDKFGIEWVYVPMVNGSMVKPGNPTLEDVNDWKTVIKFPDIETWDWEGSKAANADHVSTNRFISATILTGFFERLISFMDFDNAALALIDEDQQDAIHELFDALADLYIKMIDKFIYCYGIDQLSFHDDWGSQRAPFFSLATVREMIVPYVKKVVDYCHSRGVFFDMHSCGKNELLVPAYIEAGCDSWSGQAMNDKAMLYEKYGDKIILGIESDLNYTPGDTLPEGAADAAAKRFVSKYCANYANKPILASSFGVPPEYVEALYRESRISFNS